MSQSLETVSQKMKDSQTTKIFPKKKQLKRRNVMWVRRRRMKRAAQRRGTKEMLMKRTGKLAQKAAMRKVKQKREPLPHLETAPSTTRAVCCTKKNCWTCLRLLTTGPSIKTDN